MIETAPLPETHEQARPDVARHLGKLVHALASLRFTVVLFALSMVLVFCGTIAQKDAHIWTVVNQYFRSFFVWVPLQIFVRLGQIFLDLPQSWHLKPGIGFPFPGGWTIGFLLLFNLLAAHAVRFRFTWKRSGIMVLHLGVILLLVGEFITGVYQVEQRMTIAEGETVNFTERGAPPAVELVLSKPAGSDDVEEICIPQSLLTKVDQRIVDERLPCDLVILGFAKNSKWSESSDPAAVVGTDGNSYLAQPADEESGADAEGRENIPWVKVKFLKKGTSQELATGVFSVWYNRNSTRQLQLRSPGQFRFLPQEVAIDGQSFEVELRPVREVKPFGIKLVDFEQEFYPGTNTPKSYSSLVRVLDNERGVEREVLIYMNSPLRYRGEAFYQAGVMPGGKGTILQVVRNPGWRLPYIACGVVTLGMLMHFGMQLVTFLGRRARS